MKIKTFADACKKLGHDEKKIMFDVSWFPEQHQRALIAYAKLIIITEAINQSWKPDWNNDDEYKYYPWFYLDAPGFRFYAAYYVSTSSYTGGGSRLCYRTREDAKYAGETFTELFGEMMTIEK